jgi:hypothetical protein
LRSLSYFWKKQKINKQKYCAGMGKGRRVSRKGITAVTTVSGRSILFQNLASGYIGLAVTPSGISAGRLTNVLKAYEFYRFTKLRFRLRPGCTSTLVASLTGTADYCACWIAEVNSAGPSYAEASEQVPNVHFAPGVAPVAATTPIYPQTMPSEWVSVPREILLGKQPVKWWKSNTTSVDPLVTQGVLFVVSSYSSDVGAVLLELDYTCEFAGANVAGVFTSTVGSAGNTDSQLACDTPADVDDWAEQASGASAKASPKSVTHRRVTGNRPRPMVVRTTPL